MRSRLCASAVGSGLAGVVGVTCAVGDRVGVGVRVAVGVDTVATGMLVTGEEHPAIASKMEMTRREGKTRTVKVCLKAHLNIEYLEKIPYAPSV